MVPRAGQGFRLNPPKSQIACFRTGAIDARASSPRPPQLSAVRLWSRKQLLEKVFAHYEQLPEEILLALPLKRVWMVAQEAD